MLISFYLMILIMACFILKRSSIGELAEEIHYILATLKTLISYAQKECKLIFFIALICQKQCFLAMWHHIDHM